MANQNTPSRTKKLIATIRPLTLDTFQDRAMNTAVYPKLHGREYVILGLTSEAGEVAGARKKVLRDGINRDALIKEELGDVMWYVAAVAHEYGWTLSEVAEGMIAKLQKRSQDGTVKDR